MERGTPSPAITAIRARKASAETASLVASPGELSQGQVPPKVFDEVVGHAWRLEAGNYTRSAAYLLSVVEQTGHGDDGR